jgi:molecular chaperone GrpE
LEPEKRSPQIEPVALTESTDAKTKEALKILILERFSRWLDDVLAEEKPLEGLAAELFAELQEEKGSDTVGTSENPYDLHSTWSAMTALTQEIKLQSRTFKQFSEKMALFEGLDESIKNLLATHRETLSDARRIAEDGRADRTRRETEMKLAQRDRARRENIGVIIDIREALIIGLRSATESQGKLQEKRYRSRLEKIFMHKTADQNHQLEIVKSLQKGYRMGLDRIDETLQQLGVDEIVCQGNAFDARLMYAVDIEETGEASDGTVLEVYRTGYMIDNDVLRPAQVKVARAAERTTME